MTDFKMISLKEIHPDPNQPRRIYDETSMEELTQSVKEKGILQPILLRPNGKGFILVCGERRFRAATSAGLAEIPAVIRVLTDEEALELQIIENLQRKDVHPMEEAVAFNSLIEKKKWTAHEVSIRIGKNDRYIRQRLKLNDLVKEWQLMFFKNAFTLHEALQLCLLPEKQQKEFYKNEVGQDDEKAQHPKITINNYRIDQYKGDLHKAKFDLADTTLDKKMGACITCQFNTAAMMLFEGAADSPRCTNVSCFKHKTDIYFDRELARAKEDPSIVLVNSASGEMALVQKLKKEGHQVFRNYSDFNEIYGPDKPDWEEYKDEMIDEDNSEQKVRKDFDEEMRAYQKEQETYEKKVSTGKYKKAFVVDGHGDDTGKYIFIELKKTKAQTAAKASVDAGTADKEDVTEEIKRIQDREKRSKEIDINKIHAEIESAVKKNKSKILALEHKPIDRAIMIWILLTEIGYNPDWRNETMGYAFEKFKELAKWSDKQVAQRVRKIVFDRMVHGGSDAEVRHKHTAIRLIAEYAGIDIKAIEKEQKETADIRIERVNKRIADLNKKKKELTSVKAEKKRVKK